MLSQIAGFLFLKAELYSNVYAKDFWGSLNKDVTEKEGNITVWVRILKGRKVFMSFTYMLIYHKNNFDHF